MKNINLVYGTMNGEAKFVASELSNYLTEKSANHPLYEPIELSGWTPPENELLIIVCSSTGYGDLPDEIYPWFLELETKAPYLPTLEYGLVGLGDSSYDIFCGAIVQFETLLADLGATAIQPTLKLDATEHYAPERDAEKWLSDYVTSL